MPRRRAVDRVLLDEAYLFDDQMDWNNAAQEQLRADRAIRAEQELEYAQALEDDIRREEAELKLAEEIAFAAEAARCEQEAREKEAIAQEEADARMHLSPDSLRAQRLRVFEGLTAPPPSSLPPDPPPSVRCPHTRCMGTTRAGLQCRRIGAFADGRCAQHRPDGRDGNLRV
jgi:DNA segregation ATPase FtsK/SpoIIIE-like protein